MKKVGFATHQDDPDGTPDDLLVADALRRLGIEVVPVIWDSPAADIRDLQALVIRSCWDYHLKPDQFLAWLDTIDQANIPLVNSSKIVKWNLDKHYLKDLALQGVAIPKTVWIEPGTRMSLETILREHDIADAVIKPVISLSAFQTWRISAEQAKEYQQAFDQLVAERGVMIQAFIPEVITAGELSLIFLGNTYSHTVLKRPKAGDFRVQTDFGGTRESVTPPQHVIAQAQAIVDQIGEPLLFARVDGIEVDGRLVLMELELIDPVLFFAYDQQTPTRFAEIIAEMLNRHDEIRRGATDTLPPDESSR